MRKDEQQQQRENNAEMTTHMMAHQQPAQLKTRKQMKDEKQRKFVIGQRPKTSEQSKAAEKNPEYASLASQASILLLELADRLVSMYHQQ